MLLEKILMVAMLSASPVSMNATNDDLVAPAGNVYYDDNDTTSFNNAYQLTNNELEYAEVFGQYDDYDYIKYTATYTRCVYLEVTSTDNYVITIDVFLASKGLTTPEETYQSNDEITEDNIVCVNQGDTVYFRISTYGNCWWGATLNLNPAASVKSYYTYSKFYGYIMPRTSPSTIYYAYDQSVYTTVPGENFTFKDCLDEAMDIWESCGNISFVQNETSATFAITITNDVTDVEVVHSRKFMSINYYTSSFKMPSDIFQYESMRYGSTMPDGSQVPIRNCVLGAAMHGLGFALGLCTRPDASAINNVMFLPILPYYSLGNGDIRSFLALWGDANAS